MPSKIFIYFSSDCERVDEFNKVTCEDGLCVYQVRWDQCKRSQDCGEFAVCRKRKCWPKCRRRCPFCRFFPFLLVIIRFLIFVRSKDCPPKEGYEHKCRKRRCKYEIDECRSHKDCKVHGQDVYCRSGQCALWSGRLGYMILNEDQGPVHGFIMWKQFIHWVSKNKKRFRPLITKDDIFQQIITSYLSDSSRWFALIRKWVEKRKPRWMMKIIRRQIYVKFPWIKNYLDQHTFYQPGAPIGGSNGIFIGIITHAVPTLQGTIRKTFWPGWAVPIWVNQNKSVKWFIKSRPVWKRGKFWTKAVKWSKRGRWITGHKSVLWRQVRKRPTGWKIVVRRRFNNYPWTKKTFKRFGWKKGFYPGGYKRVIKRYGAKQGGGFKAVRKFRPGRWRKVGKRRLGATGFNKFTKTFKGGFKNFG